MCCPVISGNKSQREELDSILFIFEVSKTVFYSRKTAPPFPQRAFPWWHTATLPTPWIPFFTLLCILFVVRLPAYHLRAYSYCLHSLSLFLHVKGPHPVSLECNGCISNANVQPHGCVCTKRGCGDCSRSKKLKTETTKPRWAVSLFLFVHSVFNSPLSLELWDVPCIISNTIKPFWVKCTLASRPTGQFICLQQQHSAPRCRCLPSDTDAYRTRPLFRCLPLASPLPALCIDSPPGHV